MPGRGTKSRVTFGGWRGEASTLRSVTGVLLLLLLLIFLAQAPAISATVSGFVRGADDGEALPYASVALKGVSLGAMTNQQGYYIISSIPAGTYELRFSYIGYKAESRSIVLSEEQDYTASVELSRLPLELEAIEVEAGPNERLVEPSKLSLRTRDITKAPPVAEVDLFRSVQMLPGVSTLSDFSSGLYVRGGSPDQNLILLDDVDVYNPSHLFGFFSTDRKSTRLNSVTL